jgi:hypothetical protein
MGNADALVTGSGLAEITAQQQDTVAHLIPAFG